MKHMYAFVTHMESPSAAYEKLEEIADSYQYSCWHQRGDSLFIFMIEGDTLEDTKNRILGEVAALIDYSIGEEIMCFPMPEIGLMQWEYMHGALSQWTHYWSPQVQLERERREV